MANKVLDKSGNCIKYDGQDIYEANILSAIKTVDMNSRTLLMRGTDETIDRDGDILTYEGWKFDEFVNNPVFLWGHDYSSVPVASIPKIIKRNKSRAYDFLVKFPTEGLNPFADMILSLYAEKIINASSVGYVSDRWEYVEGSRGKKFLEKRLLELSGCAIPCNPNALQVFAGEKSFSGISGKVLTNAMINKEDIELKNKDDILEELQIKPIIIGGDKIMSQVLCKIESEDSQPIVLESKEDTKNFNALEVKYLKLVDEYKQLETKLTENENIIKQYDTEFIKAGAVLIAKNKESLSTAIKSIQSVLDSSIKEEPNLLTEGASKSVEELGSQAQPNDSKQVSQYDNILSLKVDKPRVIKQENNSEHEAKQAVSELVSNINNLRRILK